MTCWNICGGEYVIDSIINAVIKKLHTEHFGLAERSLPSPGLRSSECWIV